MITLDYVQTLARYNAWQNRNLYGEADGLSQAMRTLDRGAFFGSIHRTLCHILWADTLWMSRLGDWNSPGVGLSESPDLIADWSTLLEARAQADERIMAWAAKLKPESLAGDLSYFALSLGRELTMPRAACVMHFFNHQTHHRGQVHAMLTAAGAMPHDTDLILLPEEL